MQKILIAGGVAGGATAAARLRRLDENAQIIMFERGEHISFANCGLPYHIGGVIADRKALLLQTPENFNRGGKFEGSKKCNIGKNRGVEKKQTALRRPDCRYERRKRKD